MSRRSQSVDPSVGSNWTEDENVQLTISWRYVTHDSIVGTNQSKNGMWARIASHYITNMPGTTRNQGALTSHWKILNACLIHWKDSLGKGRPNTGSGHSLDDEIRHTQLWYSQNKGRCFTNFRCWDIVKDLPNYAVQYTQSDPFQFTDAYIPTMDSPIATSVEVNLADDGDASPIQDTPVESEAIPGGSTTMNVPRRPQGRKAAKAARKQGGQFSASMWETVVANQTMRAEDKKIREEQRALDREREQAWFKMMAEREARREEEKEERKIMSMDTTNMTPNSKAYWADERATITARKRLFREAGGSSSSHGVSSSSPGNTRWFGNM